MTGVIRTREPEGRLLENRAFNRSATVTKGNIGDNPVRLPARFDPHHIILARYLYIVFVILDNVSNILL